MECCNVERTKANLDVVSPNNSILSIHGCLCNENLDIQIEKQRSHLIFVVKLCKNQTSTDV